jgi:hypothetical protein
MKLSRFYIYLLLLPVVFFAGCKEETKYRINFYHYLHVEENGSECVDCHGELTEGMFVAADMDVCAECHEDEVEADDINAETCGKCHLEKDLDDIGAPDYERPTRGVFRHSEDLRDSCRICHFDTVKEGSTKVAFWTRADVVEIRTRAHALGRDCKTCHENLNKVTPLKNHDTNWTKRHGMFAAEEEALCTMCHNQENCRECHQREAPSSHVNLWRWQTHGVEASWNRESCQVCHQNDFCVSCHSETKPRSHVSNWQNNHGVLGDVDSCQTCHPSDFCSYCHSVTKPNSHVGGWLSGANLHCSNCHIGISNCSVCHARSVISIHSSAPPIKQPFHSLLADPTDCLNVACHSAGGAKPPLATHFIFDDSECVNCHN